jgi:hypothetical protein
MTLFVEKGRVIYSVGDKSLPYLSTLLVCSLAEESQSYRNLILCSLLKIAY